MENIEEATVLLRLIRNKNIAISIDDFGTGYSSLSYLPTLPINTLKIVIAEGVENQEELAQTSKCGIHDIQGYYYSKPLLVAKLEKNWLKPLKQTALHPIIATVF